MIPRRVFACGIALAALCAAPVVPPTRAEVAARTDESGRVQVVYVLLGLTEDGEPVPAWTPQADPGSGHRVLNPEGAVAGDGPPAILLHPHSGVPLVAWSRATESGRVVVSSRFAEGAWTSPAVVAAEPGDTAAALDPQLAVDPESGVVHLVYWVDDGAPHVIHRALSADLATWGAPTVVSQPAENALWPAVVVHDGRLLVAYGAHPAGAGTTPRQIVVAEHVEGAWVGEVVADTAFAGANAPRIHSRPGRIWVDWFDGAGVMRWSSRADGEGWTALNAEPFAGGEDREFHVRGRVRAAVRTLD